MRFVGGKRGLAPVLSVALITLGVIIGVALLWIFAQKSLDRGKDVIDPDCFTVDIKLNSCVAYGACSYGAGGGHYDADILVKRGIGRANLTGIRFSFEDTFGKKGVYDYNLTGVALEELQNLRFDYFPAKVPIVTNDPYLVRAIALVGKKHDACPSASEPVFCNIAPGYLPPPLGAIPGTTTITGQCCQCPKNLTECYDGGDSNYPIPSTGPNAGLVIHNGAPVNGTAPGFKSVCCQWDPSSGLGSTCPSV